jgi:hypothetical protein
MTSKEEKPFDETQASAMRVCAAGGILKAEGMLRGILASTAAMLDGIEHCPRMYAVASEALEVQALFAIDLRQNIVRPMALLANPDETRVAYDRFIQSINGSPTNAPLYAVLRKLRRSKELPKLLGQFGRQVALELPPEAAWP